MTGSSHHRSESSSSQSTESMASGSTSATPIDSLQPISSLQIIVHKLNGGNYLEWAQSMKLAIDGRGKLGHMTGETTRPTSTDPTLPQWRSDNSLIISWLLNSIDPLSGNHICLFPRPKRFGRLSVSATLTLRIHPRYSIWRHVCGNLSKVTVMLQYITILWCGFMAGIGSMLRWYMGEPCRLCTL